MKKLNISRAMKERGFNAKKIASKLGVSSMAISSRINGNPTVSSLEDIARVLECDITDLFFDDTSAPSDSLFYAAASTEQTTEQTAEAHADTKTPVQGADAVPQDAREMMYCPHCGTKFFVAHVPHA